MGSQSSSVKTPSLSVVDNKVCGSYTFKGTDTFGSDSKYYIAFGERYTEDFGVKDVSDQIFVNKDAFDLDGAELATTIGNSAENSGFLYVFGLVTKDTINLFTPDKGPSYNGKTISTEDWVASFGTDPSKVTKATKVVQC